MSGVPAPLYPVVRAFGNDAIPPTDAGGATLPIPVASQVGVLVGAASFEDGFPAATMSDPEAGGIPPYGQDMNGLLFMLSQYAALIQAGQTAPYNAAAVAAFAGYKVGAIVQGVADPSQFFYNIVDGNSNDPEVLDTGWVAFSPLAAPTLVQTPAALPAGATNDLPVSSRTGFIDLAANAAGSDLTGFAGGFNGQIIVATNVSVNPLTFKALTGSAAGNQFRLPADITVFQYGNLTFRKSTALNVWVPMS